MSATTNARGNNANDDQRPLIDYEDGKVITCESEEDFYEIIRLASFSVTNDGTSTSATTTQSSEGQSHDRLIVFDCYADWCPPCRQMSPIFAGMAKDYPHIIFVKVNVDKHPEIGKLLVEYGPCQHLSFFEAIIKLVLLWVPMNVCSEEG